MALHKEVASKRRQQAKLKKELIAWISDIDFNLASILVVAYDHAEEAMYLSSNVSSALEAQIMLESALETTKDEVNEKDVDNIRQ